MSEKLLLSDLCRIIGAVNSLQDFEVDYICFNHKFLRSNSVYFTIVTEGFDGYNFDYDKIKSLNCVVVTTKQIEDLPCIIVENPLSALYKVAAYCRNRYDELKSVIVTGSVGKTSAKEMLYSVLSAGAKSVRNAGSANSTREACRMIFNIDDRYRFAIMELGLRAPNMPFRMGSNILRPDAVLITNIGNSHIENFKDKAQILEHKLSAAAFMKKDGVLFLNGDDELMFNSKYNFKVVFFGIENKNCDYIAENIVLTNEGCDFTAVSKDRSWSLNIHLNVPGKHNILNALGAAAIARCFGVSDGDIQKGAANFKTQGFRQNVVRGYKNNIIIADCYNATPESMISGFEMLKNMQCAGRKIAVLGHMMRLGIHSEQLHRKTGRDVSAYNFDLVLTYGLHAEYIYDEIKKAGGQGFHFYTKDDLVDFLKSYVKEDDVILFKGVEKFHNFQDLFYRFNDVNYVPSNDNYLGLKSLDNSYHSEAKSMYFGDENTCYVSKNANEKILIKDLSILLGVLMVLERCEIDENVIITQTAAQKFVPDTGIRFNLSNIFTVEDLCYAAMFKSSFEAIYALIEYCFGTWDDFEKNLTEKLSEIGALNTKISSFSNEIFSETYTTAYDMFLIVKYALNNPKFFKIISDKVHVLNNLKSGKQTRITTNNNLLIEETRIQYLNYYCENALGIKAENVYNDKNEIFNQSLVSCVEKDSRKIIGVILGSDEFYYCRNSYIDMKRIFENIINF